MFGLQLALHPYPSLMSLRRYAWTHRTFSNFPLKTEQIRKVEEYIVEKGLIPPGLVKQEIASFYNHLGIDDMYFQQETVEGVGNHIIGLYGAKVQAYVNEGDIPQISLERQTDSTAVYIHTLRPGESLPKDYELKC
jgi:glutamate dehydrogenase